jgi:hypothetical protein
MDDSLPKRLTYAGNDDYLPPMGPNMETRITKLEADVAAIKTEVGKLKWWTVGTAIASVIAMAGVVVGLGALLSTWTQGSLAQSREELRSSLTLTTEELRRTTDSRMDELRRITDRQWEMTQKALEKASDVAIKAEALRLVQEEREKKP